MVARPHILFEGFLIVGTLGLPLGWHDMTYLYQCELIKWDPE